MRSLSYVKDPIVAEYLGRVIERGKANESLGVELRAIEALENLKTAEAREVLSTANFSVFGTFRGDRPSSVR